MSECLQDPARWEPIEERSSLAACGKRQKWYDTANENCPLQQGNVKSLTLLGEPAGTRTQGPRLKSTTEQQGNQ
jgi:hypothetical protein